MNSVKIGTYQMDTAFGLYLPEYTIPAPAPQTKFVKIIGRDGSVDLSDAIGLHYDSRSWSLDFKCFDPTVNWHTLTSSVMNAIHGKRLNFEFDDDPDYFWTGRISVSSYVSTRGTGTLKVNITSDPFKYAKLSTIVTKTASTGTEYTGSMVTFNDGLIYDLSADIEPTQDLHGYDSPWPGGGGVNKYPNCVINGSQNGLIVSHDAGSERYNISAGTVSGYAQIVSGETFTLSAGTYYWHVDYSSGSVLAGLAPQLRSTDGLTTYATPNTSFTLSADTELKPRITCQANVTIPSNFSVRLEIVSGSTAPTSWTPYSNICPISGLTGLSVYVSPTQNPNDATVYNVDWSTQAGTVYGGTVDVVTGLLTVDWTCTNLSTSWYWYVGNTQPSGKTVATTTSFPAHKGNIAICSHYKRSNSAYVVNLNNGEFILADGGVSAYFCFKNEAGGTAQEFKDIIAAQEAAGTPIQVCYELATPITYQLTPQEIEALVGTNNVWSSSGDVTVTVVTPETVTNNGLPAVPTVTASADMVLRWGNYSASVQQGTSTIPQLVLETGDNKICIIGAGNISFEWSEASL